MKLFKHSTFVLLALSITVALFTACSNDSDEDSTDSGTTGNVNATTVVINGVKWANCNVDAPGTFANSPEASGKFYQWNSKVALATTGTVTGWNSSWYGGFTSPIAADTWATANDPSPEGYRLPTITEIRSLVDATKVTATWTTQNGVYGEKFTDKTSGNFIFMPAAGSRNYYNGDLLVYTGAPGYYWSSNGSSSVRSYNLSFGTTYATCDVDSYRAYGYSIRPVAK